MESLIGARSIRNKRRHERYSCNLKMTYTILSSSDSTPYEYGVAHSRNLSESGVSIYTEQQIRVPILMQLNINLPMRPFHLLILAKAVRCRRAEDSNFFEVGLKFVGILPPEFKRLVSRLAPGEDQEDDAPRDSALPDSGESAQEGGLTASGAN